MMKKKGKSRDLKLNRVVSFLLIILVSSVSLADDMSKINEIKLDERFIYGEYSHEDESLAYEGALADFIFDVNSYRNDNGQKPLQISDVVGRVKKMKHKINEKSYCLVYADFDEMMSIEPKEGDVVAVVEQSSTPTNTASEESLQQNISTQHQPNSAQENSLSNENVDLEIVEVDNGVYNQINAYLCELKMAKDVVDNLKYFKQKGTISEMGLVENRVAPDDAYILVFEVEHGALKLKYILSPIANGKRNNLLTGQEDDMSNYPKGQFLWYK